MSELPIVSSKKNGSLGTLEHPLEPAKLAPEPRMLMCALLDKNKNKKLKLNLQWTAGAVAFDTGHPRRRNAPQ